MIRGRMDGFQNRSASQLYARTYIHLYTDSLFVPVEHEGELKYVMTFTYYYYSVECTEQITDFLEILIVEYYVCFLFLSIVVFCLVDPTTQINHGT